MSVRFSKTRPTLGVKDVPRSIAFYKEALGLEVEAAMGEPPMFALLARDGVGLGLFQVASPAVADFACCYFDIEGVEEAHERCVRAGAVIASPLTRQPWGNHDFVVKDPDGHQIALGEVPRRAS